jgi:hypothetical protein
MIRAICRRETNYAIRLGVIRSIEQQQLDAGCVSRIKAEVSTALSDHGAKRGTSTDVFGDSHDCLKSPASG